MPVRELRAWIGERREDTPTRLIERVDEVFAAHPDWGGLEWPEAFCAAGESLLDCALGASASETRQSALDLLAADACVTWAFEAAADAPHALGARTRDAMRRIAGLAEGAA